MAHYAVVEDDWEVVITNNDEITTQEISEVNESMQDDESMIRAVSEADESIHENESIVDSVKYAIPSKLQQV
jgi:acetylglutamate kinase